MPWLPLVIFGVALFSRFYRLDCPPGVVFGALLVPAELLMCLIAHSHFITPQIAHAPLSVPLSQMRVTSVVLQTSIQQASTTLTSTRRWVSSYFGQ